MITDQANAPVAKAMAVQTAEITTEAQTQHSSQVFPNPVTDRFVLQVDNAYTGPLNIQVIDINGAVKKQFNVSKNQAGATQLYLSAADLTAGEYILQLQMLKWNDSVKIVKQ
jgi:endoglucanase